MNTHDRNRTASNALNSNPKSLSQSLVQSLGTPDTGDDFDGLTPQDLPAEQVERFLRSLHWRETHLPEPEPVRDPTFRQMLAQTSHTPLDPTHRRAKRPKRHVTHPLASLPTHDLTFTATCIDGPFEMTGREVQILMSARRLGVLPIVDTTRQMLRDLIDGWC